MSFRLKLLLAMMLLVVGVTVTTLLITETQVRVSYERHFHLSFFDQLAFFLQQREARLEPIKERVLAAAASTRLLAAMQEHDIDDLYQNGLGNDQLSQLITASPTGNTNRFFVFLNNKAQLLYPSAQAKLPFSLRGLRAIAPEVEAVGASALHANSPQIGYLAPGEEPGSPAIREMVFTPIIDQVDGQRVGVLAVGFPLPSGAQNNPILSAIWLDNKLHSSSLPESALKEVQEAIGSQLRGGTTSRRELSMRLGDTPYQVYWQPLGTGSAFPPAYQVCLYSLADAANEKRQLTQKILLSAVVASLGALVLSWLISRGMTVPLQELASGAAAIERGEFTAKVPVRSRDELGHLGRAFNAMAEQIQSTYSALQQRIAERTHELNERKRAEEALRKSEASLREAQRIAHLGNWDLNVQSNELHWSDEIYSIFGLVPQQFGPSYTSFLERVHPADREQVEQAVRESTQTGKDFSLEHRVVRPDGKIRIVRQKAETLRDPTGRTTRLIGTVQDVTEQKRIEAEFLRAQRMDGIGAIAGGMAHDLNNALAPILMGIQLIRNRVAEPDVRQMLSVMETSTHRGADMVRQVLTFARGRDGERELLEVGRLIRDMENILRQTMPKSILVEAMLPSDLWPVLGNATQLHQALLNLCVNARDAMPTGGRLTIAADNVELTAEEARELPDGRPGPFVMILVSDTGTGIPPEVLPKIFEAFFTTKAPGKGTGLGLSTIVRIVRNHGGVVTVKSEVGTGTSFEIYLPRAEPEPASRTAAPPQASLRPGHGELLLFIDDDQSVREMVAPALKEQGYHVLTAANGAEALALLEGQERQPRLVLSDIAMPVMDGLEITEKLHTRWPDLPIVLISGTFDVEKQALPTGVIKVLTKPFRLEQLLAVTAEALQKHPAASAEA
jgi:PAS domain S-box-containing protein